MATGAEAATLAQKKLKEAQLILQKLFLNHGILTLCHERLSFSRQERHCQFSSPIMPPSGGFKALSSITVSTGVHPSFMNRFLKA